MVAVGRVFRGASRMGRCCEWERHSSPVLTHAHNVGVSKDQACPESVLKKHSEAFPNAIMEGLMDDLVE